MSALLLLLSFAAARAAVAMVSRLPGWRLGCPLQMLARTALRVTVARTFSARESGLDLSGMNLQCTPAALGVRDAERRANRSTLARSSRETSAVPGATPQSALCQALRLSQRERTEGAGLDAVVASP